MYKTTYCSCVDAEDDLFGMKVNAQNIDEVIETLEKQLN